MRANISSDKPIANVNLPVKVHLPELGLTVDIYILEDASELCILVADDETSECVYSKLVKVQHADR